jgi:CheY-like chemotaxis protein
MHAASGMCAAQLSEVQGFRALVADDDLEFLDVVSKALEQFGAAVVRASSGGELLEEIAARAPFDVVITDVTMPWMSGLQVMHSARTAGLSGPILVITGSRDAKTAAQVAALGERVTLLYKPFSIAELRAALQICMAA